MNLFEFLDTYKTNPSTEIEKINSILNRTEYVSGIGQISLKDAFDYVYANTPFASHEPDIDSFLKKILNGYHFGDTSEAILSYRFLCEFILALLTYPMDYAVSSYFEDHMEQLKKIIVNGLNKSGYEIVPYGKMSVTKKKDEQAETIASANETYKKNILDYLLTKGVDEKEKVLTSICVQLEALKPIDNYVKECREWIQLLRHKDENINSQKYSWFFIKETYEENLDKLFRICLSIIAHDGCRRYLDDFKKNRGGFNE